MSPLRILIADDEPLARDGLRTFFEAQHDAIVVAECADGAQAVEAIRRHKPDIVILDVQMPRLDGFGVVAAIGAAEMPCVVFVTAYDEYACRAFDVSAVDYVLKPVDPARLREAYERAVRSLDRVNLAALREALATLHHRASNAASLPATEAERLPVRSGDRIEFLEPLQIDWIESEGNYARVHALGRSFLVRHTLDTLHRRLGVASFIRVRRSLLVRVRAIRACEPMAKGSYVLVLHDGKRLISSRYFRTNLRPLLGES